MTSADVSDPPTLGYPLEVAWSVETGDYPDCTPVILGERAIVASGRRLLALALADGTLLWARDYPATLVDLVAAGGLAVVSHNGAGGRTVLEALDGDGRTRWRGDDDWSAGSRALRGDGERLLALGARLGPGQAQTCRVLRARDGTLESEVAVHGSCPVLAPVPAGEVLVFGCSQGNPERVGLFSTTLAGVERRLHPAPVSVLAVCAGVALCNGWHEGAGELYAVDLADGRELWRAPGGPVTHLPCDRGQVAVARGVAKGRAAPGLRDIRTGTLLWEGEPAEAFGIRSALAADLVVADIDASELRVYRRTDGTLVQTLPFGCGFRDGPLATPLGLLGSPDTQVHCLRAAGADAGAS